MTQNTLNWNLNITLKTMNCFTVDPPPYGEKFPGFFLRLPYNLINRFLNLMSHLRLSFQTLRRSTDSVLRKREQKLARISILIVIIFIICHSLKNIPTLFEIFGKDPRVSRWKYDDWMIDIWSVIDLCKELAGKDRPFQTIMSILNFSWHDTRTSKMLINIWKCLACSRLLSNPPDWPSSFEH